MSRRKYLEAYIALIDEFLIIAVIIALALIALRMQGWISVKTVFIAIAVSITAGLGLFKALAKVIPRKPVVGAEALIGKKGTAKTDINGEGYVLIEGELWRARSAKGERIKMGERVRVVGVYGLTVLVERA